MEDEVKGLFGMFRNSTERINNTIDKMEKQRKIAFCQWLTNMSLQYGKTPEHILKKFKKSFSVMKKQFNT